MYSYSESVALVIVTSCSCFSVIVSVRLARCVSIYVIDLLISINCSLVYTAVLAESIAEATEPIPRSSGKIRRF